MTNTDDSRSPVSLLKAVLQQFFDSNLNTTFLKMKSCKNAWFCINFHIWKNGFNFMIGTSAFDIILIYAYCIAWYFDYAHNQMYGVTQGSFLQPPLFLVKMVHNLDSIYLKKADGSHVTTSPLAYQTHYIVIIKRETGGNLTTLPGNKA